MGRGSRNFSVYYGFSSLAYLMLSISTFVALSSVTSTCREKCPLLVNDIDPVTKLPLYTDCQCGALGALGLNGNITNPTSAQQLQRYNQVRALTYDTSTALTTGACYICVEAGKDDVYEACDTFEDCTKDGLLGFRPAQISSDQLLCNTSRRDSTVRASALVSYTISFRKYVNSILYFLAVNMLLMGLVAAVCAWAFGSFVHKYEDDWVKLSFYETVLGSLCKAMPILSRLLNIVMCFVVVGAVVIVFAWDVCYYDVDQFGDQSFREVVTGVLAAISVFWLFMCTFGSLFNRWIPRDTPFYTPKFPADKDVSVCYMLSCALFISKVTTRCVWFGAEVLFCFHPTHQ
jgi:hypothetical protein